MRASLQFANLLGAIVAVLFYVSAILVFVFRLLGMPEAGSRIGVFELCLILPLVYLLAQAPALNRPALYFVQIGLMLLWLVLEFLLDYWPKVGFRQINWIVICYVTLFFAAAGGMLGVAAKGGRVWTAVSAALFLIMTALAFFQRGKTGL